LSREHIPRRTFLPARAWLSVWPLLDSMIPAATRSRRRGAKRPQRSSRLFPALHGARVGGLLKKRARPAGKEAAAYSQSLSRCQDRTSCLKRPVGRSRRSRRGTTGADHLGRAAYLTCTSSPRRDGPVDANRRHPRRSDQIHRRKAVQESCSPPLSSRSVTAKLELSNCGEGYSCSYKQNTRIRSRGSTCRTRRPASPCSARARSRWNSIPAVVFDGCSAGGATAGEPGAIRGRTRILDSVARRVSSLRKDRARKTAHGREPC